VCTHCQSVEQIVTLRLRFSLENLDVLEDLRVDLNFLVESHGIFTQKVENNLVWRFQSNVFVSQRAATDRIRLVFSFFVTRTESKSINEVQSGSSLSVGGYLGFEVNVVILADFVDVVL
jgi:hypothetical protein